MVALGSPRCVPAAPSISTGWQGLELCPWGQAATQGPAWSCPTECQPVLPKLPAYQEPGNQGFHVSTPLSKRWQGMSIMSGPSSGLADKRHVCPRPLRGDTCVSRDMQVALAAPSSHAVWLEAWASYSAPQTWCGNRGTALGLLGTPGWG